MRRLLAIACFALLAWACGGPSTRTEDAGPTPAFTSTPIALTATFEPTASAIASAPSWSAGDPAELADRDRFFVVEVATGAVLEVDGRIVGWSQDSEALVATPGGIWLGRPGESLRKALTYAPPTQTVSGPNIFVAGDGRRRAGEPPVELRFSSASALDDEVIATFDEDFIDFVNVSPDAGYATVNYYSRGTGGFYVVDLVARRKLARVAGANIGQWLDSSHLLYTANACGGREPPVISADGLRAPFVPTPDIAVLDVTILESRDLAATDVVEQDGRLSPDHSTVGFLERSDAHSPTGSAIVVVDLGSGERNRIVEVDAEQLLFGSYAAPSNVWSPDGRYIAFATAGRSTYLHGGCQDSWSVETVIERLK